MKKVDQPKRLTYRQLSGVKTYNLHVPAKTGAFVVKWPSDPEAQWSSGPAAQRPSGPADQRPSDQATYNSTATYTDSSCTASSSNRKSTGVLKYQSLTVQSS